MYFFEFQVIFSGLKYLPLQYMGGEFFFVQFTCYFIQKDAELESVKSQI